MRFVCESCRAQYMINDEKVGPKGVKVRCRKCGYVILVKRSDAAKPAAAITAAPMTSLADPDDGNATQVMQTQMGLDAEPKTEIMSQALVGLTDSLSGDDEAASKAPKNGTDFLGADDDEIGAVFDQVLKGSPSESRNEDKPRVGLDEDRQNTRVLDPETALKLADESSDRTVAEAPSPDAVPETDWYVAINDKQTGPLTLEVIKAHWDKGEIGPDSLCWRAGYSDWAPLSEVKALASVLAPKPPKPIVVAAAATVSSMPPGPAVMSVPVQSAFSSGGVMQTVQSEVQVPIAVAAPEETGTWRPTAASALASLVKDEMEAMAKPSVSVRPPAEDEVPRASGGLLDLPEERSVSHGHAQTAERLIERRAPPPVNPYLANSGGAYNAPPLTQYRPPSSRGVLIGVGLGGVAILGLVVLVVWLALREPKVAAVPPAPIAANTAAPVPSPAVAAPVPIAPNAAPAGASPSVPVAGSTPAEAQPAPTGGAALAVAPSQPTAPGPSHLGGGSRRLEARPESRERVARAEPPPEPDRKVNKAQPEPPIAAKGDDFDEAFGTGGTTKKAEKKAADDSSSKKPSVYIPPAPGGGGDIKDELGQSDIFEVVLANKPALAKCVEEQHKKDPGSGGKLVMKWTVQTNGRTTNVGVASEEFKGTYIAGCITGLVKTWTFPRSKKQADPVQFPFKF